PYRAQPHVIKVPHEVTAAVCLTPQDTSIIETKLFESAHISSSNNVGFRTTPMALESFVEFSILSASVELVQIPTGA
uniref:Uncharacterized protein n=1 Tax=Ciona intestinalis TaxID=7719 RepID=H2Y2N3_CIOIN